MFRDKKGMTLIEVMIALMLLSITSLALVQSALVAINTNLINELRDEAVSVAAQRMNELRNTPWSPPYTDMLVTSPTGSNETITRNVRSLTQFPFTVNRVVSQAGASNRQVTLTVTWNYRNIQYTHGASTLMVQK